MAPYVRPLAQQDQQINQKVKMHRWMKPNDKRSDEELYNYYLKDYIFQFYPIYEPVVKEHPWRLEAIYNMVIGIRHVDIIALAKANNNVPVHFVTGEKDQYVPKQDHVDYWNATQKSVKASKLEIKGCEHKIPEAQPEISASWIYQIVTKNPDLQKGLEFSGDPQRKQATSGSVKINL